VAVVKELKATASLDFPSIAAQGQQELTIAIAGALAGAPVVVGVNAAPPAGIVLMGYCVLNDVITVRALNITAGAIDPGSLSVTVGARVLA
jgi:hypothetical protein